MSVLVNVPQENILDEIKTRYHSIGQNISVYKYTQMKDTDNAAYATKCRYIYTHIYLLSACFCVLCFTHTNTHDRNNNKCSGTEFNLCEFPLR